MTTKIEKCPTCGADAIDRSEFWEAFPESGFDIFKKLSKVRQTITRFHYALDRGQKYCDAQAIAMADLHTLLDMDYEPGAVERFLQEHPKLKALYE